MTAVGKILVFFNLVFAFVIGTFAVLGYIARTHWADQYVKLENSYKVVQASAEAHKRENDKLIEDRKIFAQKMQGRVPNLDPKGKPDDVANAVADKLVKQADEIKDLKTGLKDEQKKTTKLENDVTQFRTAATVAQADVKRREENETNLRANLKEEVTRNNQLLVGINDMRDRAVAAEITAKSLKGRNVQLEDQLQGLSREVVRLKASGAGVRPTAQSASGRNPPPDQVEGLIQRVDGDLVTLTIGSDAGLQRGHTMFVFGLGNNVGYRGEIKLLEVQAKVSVGQVIKGKQVARIRPGDTVASEIMPRR